MFRLVPKDTLQAFPQSRARQWIPKQPSSHLRCSFMGKQMDLTRSPIWRFLWNLETSVLVDWHWNMLQPVSIASLARLTRKSWDHVLSISQPVTFRFFGASDPVPGLSVPLAFSAALSNALDNSTLLFASPKAPRLKKINLEIGFWKKSICDWKLFFFNLGRSFLEIVRLIFRLKMKIANFGFWTLFLLNSRLNFRLIFRLNFEKEK